MNASTARLICLQQLSILLLVGTLTLTAFYARTEKQRADQWRADSLRLQSQVYALQAAPAVDTASSLQSRSSDYYPTTLIAEDDSQTPLEGKAIHVDLGGGRLLEIEMARQQTDYLHMWAPARRDDEYWNRVVFHPHCANSYSLELIRVSAKSGGIVLHSTR